MRGPAILHTAVVAAAFSLSVFGQAGANGVTLHMVASQVQPNNVRGNGDQQSPPPPSANQAAQTPLYQNFGDTLKNLGVSAQNLSNDYFNPTWREQYRENLQAVRQAETKMAQYAMEMKMSAGDIGKLQVMLAKKVDEQAGVKAVNARPAERPQAASSDVRRTPNPGDRPVSQPQATTPPPSYSRPGQRQETVQIQTQSGVTARVTILSHAPTTTASSAPMGTMVAALPTRTELSSGGGPSQTRSSILTGTGPSNGGVTGSDDEEALARIVDRARVSGSIPGSTSQGIRAISREGSEEPEDSESAGLIVVAGDGIGAAEAGVGRNQNQLSARQGSVLPNAFEEARQQGNSSNALSPIFPLRGFSPDWMMFALLAGIFILPFLLFASLSRSGQAAGAQSQAVVAVVSEGEPTASDFPSAYRVRYDLSHRRWILVSRNESTGAESLVAEILAGTVVPASALRRNDAKRFRLDEIGAWMPTEEAEKFVFSVDAKAAKRFRR